MRPSRQPLACLFVGIDGLEDASHDGGQQVANRALIECASRLMARARQTDLAGATEATTSSSAFPTRTPTATERSRMGSRSRSST
jgi:GGDEF domain-containing protein